MTVLPGYKSDIELTELYNIDTKVRLSKGAIPAIKTENYSLYSVPDPHAKGLFPFIVKYMLKNSLILDSSHQIFEARIPLAFDDYARNRNKLLSEIGKVSDFTINKLRIRDVLFALLRRRLLKEVAYGKNIAVAFYSRLTGGNYLEFIYHESPITELTKIQKGLKSLLLAKPKVEGVG